MALRCFSLNNGIYDDTQELEQHMKSDHIYYQTFITSSKRKSTGASCGAMAVPTPGQLLPIEMATSTGDEYIPIADFECLCLLI